MKNTLSTIEEAISDLAQGKMIILVDDDDRENEGDLVVAAEKVTPEAVNFMAKHGRGLICLSMTTQDIKRLRIPMMVEKNNSKYETAFTVSIEAATGVTTGISVHDRARTILIASDPNSTPADVISPGHIFPIRARDGGVLVRAGHTEGSVDLVRLAKLQPSAVICEILTEEGSPAKLDDLRIFAKQHDLKIVSINELIAYRMRNECLVEDIANATLPIPPYGDFKIRVFRSVVDNVEHVALVKEPIDYQKTVLVRVHSECLTGDVFGSGRCDCGWQLDAALKRIGESGGILLYMSQEGRGIGLMNKIKAYALQEQGFDTVEANHKLGFSDDHRDYGIGSQILRYLGVTKMCLLTNNPRKIYGLEGYGLEIVDIEPIQSQPTRANLSYLQTKKRKLGHLLSLEGIDE